MATLLVTAIPQYKFWKYCGTLSFKVVNRAGIAYLEPCYVHQIISSIFYVILFIAWMFSTYAINIANLTYSSVDFLTFTVYNVLGTFQIYFNTIAVKINNGKMLKILNGITEIEMKMADIDLSLNNKMIKVEIVCFLIYFITSQVFFIGNVLPPIVDDKSIDKVHIMRILVIWLSFIVETNSFIKYLILLLTAKHILAHLNSGLEALGIEYRNNSRNISNKHEDIRILRQMAQIYQQFFEWIQDLNSLLSLTTLSQIAINFAFIVLEIFNYYSIVTDHEQYEDENLYSTVEDQIGSIVIAFGMFLMYAIVTELYLKQVKI